MLLVIDYIRIDYLFVQNKTDQDWLTCLNSGAKMRNPNSPNIIWWITKNNPNGVVLGQSLSDSHGWYLKTLVKIYIIWICGNIPLKVKLWIFHYCTIKKFLTYSGIGSCFDLSQILTTDSEPASSKTYILTIWSSQTVEDSFSWIWYKNTYQIHTWWFYGVSTVAL